MISSKFGVAAVLIAFINLANTTAVAQAEIEYDAIIGLWKADEKGLTVEVFKTANSFQGKIISFTGHHSSNQRGETG